MALTSSNSSFCKRTFDVKSLDLYVLLLVPSIIKETVYRANTQLTKHNPTRTSAGGQEKLGISTSCKTAYNVLRYICACLRSQASFSSAAQSDTYDLSESRKQTTDSADDSVAYDQVNTAMSESQVVCQTLNLSQRQAADQSSSAQKSRKTAVKENPETVKHKITRV